MPTYREALNLPLLIDRVAAVAREQALAIEMIVVDDDSRDGSLEIVRARPEPWVRILVRNGERGLGSAVLEGMRRASGDVLVCMDADLSHPPEALPAMLAKLDEGADCVIGSRYAPGGSTSHDWGFLRWLNSRVATALARPLTHVTDPMAGYFALRRETLARGQDLDPIGYKICLELVVKCRCERVVEIPIHFEDRRYGESKLTLRQQLLFLKHLRRLYAFKYGPWSPVSRFVVVGGLGTAVNLLLLTALVAVGARTRLAVAAAILGSMSFNFAISRRIGPRSGSESWPGELKAFLLAASPGALVNYAVTMGVIGWQPALPPQLAALGGIVAGAVFNFVASRFVAFRAAHVRPRGGGS